MLQKSHLYKTTTASSLCFLTYPNNFMFFLWANIWSTNYGKLFKKCMKPREQLQKTYFQLISSELVTWHEIIISFLTKAYFLTSNTHVRKMRFIADITVEIFKIKNWGVGNLFKYILYMKPHGKKRQSFGTIVLMQAERSYHFEHWLHVLKK